MKKPNLFIVGAPKSGTSALYDFLGQHPDIFMPKYKEPHFFSKDLQNESDIFHGFLKHYPFRTENAYLSLFSEVKNEKIIGDASTHALFSEVAAKEIYDFNSNSKIIIMLREPIEYLHSLHSQLYKHLDENIGDFKKALELEESRKSGEDLPEMVEFPSKLYYSDWAKFDIQLSRYFKIFDKSKIKIILFDDFKSDNIKICKEVFSFLNVDDSFTPRVSIVHSNKILKHRGFIKFLKNPLVFKIMKIIPRKHYSAIGRKLHNLLYKTQKRESLDYDFSIKLKIKYKSVVENLSRMLNKDLISIWGYDKI